MANRQAEYLLSLAPNEIERLQKWGRIGEPEAEAMLDHIGVRPGWRCLDLGCGPMGILGALSRRVGPTGWVVGADINPTQLAAARELTEREGLTNVEFVQADAFDTHLPRESFALVGDWTNPERLPKPCSQKTLDLPPAIYAVPANPPAVTHVCVITDDYVDNQNSTCADFPTTDQFTIKGTIAHQQGGPTPNALRSAERGGTGGRAAWMGRHACQWQI